MYLSTPVAAIITNGFFTIDREWTVKNWNRAAERLLGIKADKIIGRNLWERFAGIIPLAFYDVYHKAFLQGSPVHFTEYWGEMGAWFDVITYYSDETLSVSFKSSNEPINPEYSINAGQPLQPLKIMTEMYRLVTEITNDAIWEWDLQSREIFWIDGGHKRLFGYKIENALIPQSFWENCIHPDDKNALLSKIKKITAEGSEIWESDYRFKCANGGFAYVHDRGHIIYDEKKKAIRMVVATQDITEKTLLENKLAEERRIKQKEITTAVITGQENERAMIGMELHDNLNQMLAVAMMYLQMAKVNEPKKDDYLEESKSLIAKVIKDIRSISKTLVIPGTHIIGLFDNIKNLIDDLMQISPIKIGFKVAGIIEFDLDEKLQINIFRIIQEQTNNILKHARATKAFIKLSREQDAVNLVITDNGEGCEILKEQNGVGIINIQSRADLYDGSVTIKSSPGKGYELKVVLPVKPNIKLG